MQLGADEPDRDDAVLLRGAKQPEACAIARRLVLKEDLVEARERVPHVGGVVYREMALPVGIDVCERAVGELCARSCVQPRHRQMMARAARLDRSPPPRPEADEPRGSAPGYQGPATHITSEGVGAAGMTDTLCGMSHQNSAPRPRSGGTEWSTHHRPSVLLGSRERA